MSKYTDWLHTLDGRQIRALAAQAKIKTWRTDQIDKLVSSLWRNSKGHKIWKENYGKRLVERCN